MNNINQPYLFVSPDREQAAVNRPHTWIPMSMGIPIRVSAQVPKGELWWGVQLPNETEIVGDEVRTVSRIRIIHKLTVDPVE